jgi:hypothetical protein
MARSTFERLEGPCFAGEADFPGFQRGKFLEYLFQGKGAVYLIPFFIQKIIDKGMEGDFEGGEGTGARKGRAGLAQPLEKGGQGFGLSGFQPQGFRPEAHRVIRIGGKLWNVVAFGDADKG